MAAIRGNSPKIFHKWKPIEPIISVSQTYDFGEIDSLQRQWLHIKRQVERSAPDAYKAFTDRLTRRWSIETGIIEGIYDLDRGVTETLIEKGIAADYIERSSTNKEPSELVQILNDHQESVASVNYWIEQSRPLTKTFIQSLHTQILNSQDTHAAVNQFGQRFEATLHKGEFKTQPNNPTRPDGSVHEYCPPEQVESELDNLLSMYEEYDNQDCHPLLLAAWLHHRFTEIHPFEDGNGRVGRAILTWHLVRKEFLPIVISRDDRTEYIDSLEEADKGDLTRLIDLFVHLEKNTILQVLDKDVSESQPEPQGDLVDLVVASIVERAKQRTISESEQMRSVNHIASVLQREAQLYLNQKSQDIRERLREAHIFVEPGVSGETTQIAINPKVRSSLSKIDKWLPYRINFNESGRTVYLFLDVFPGTRTPKLTFVISLHHAGHQLSGIMAAVAFAETEYKDFATPTPGGSIRNDVPTFHNCTVTPFTFTWNDSAEEISDRFIRWTESCLSVALRYWMDNS